MSNGQPYFRSPDLRIIATADELAGGGVVTKLLNHQPLGITSDPKTGKIAICSYFNPAVVIGTLETTPDGYLVLREEWIRGAEGTVRLMPPDVEYGRAQTANVTPSGGLLVTWNGGRKISKLSPPAKPGDRWKFATMIDFSDDVEPGAMIHSLLIKDLSIHTIESDPSCEMWTINAYSLHIDSDGGHHIERVSSRSIPPFRYGIGIRPDDDRLWTVTDGRSSEPHGIYADDELVIPSVHGNGIAFMSDGSALVTQYNDEDMEPGALVYVPAAMFARFEGK